MSRSLKSFAHLLRGEICWSSPLPEQVTGSTGMAVSSISGFALRSICTRLVILWWTHFFLHFHFFLLCLWIKEKDTHLPEVLKTSVLSVFLALFTCWCETHIPRKVPESENFYEILRSRTFVKFRRNNWLYSQLFLRNSPHCLRGNQGLLRIHPM